jgi:hypothetical protein
MKIDTERAEVEIEIETETRRREGGIFEDGSSDKSAGSEDLSLWPPIPSLRSFPTSSN